MKTEISYSPAFAMATVHMDQGESVKAEAGAMMAMTPSVEIQTSTKGGVLKGLKRSVLGGESFFMNTFTANGPDAHVVVAPALPGDIITWPLTGNTVYLQSGSYLASPETIDVDSKWGGAKTFFSREGLFMLKCTGTGDLVVSSYGAIQAIDLAAGPELHRRHRPHGRLGGRRRLRGAEGRQLEVDDPRRRGPRREADRPGPGLHPDPQPRQLPRLADPEAPDQAVVVAARQAAGAGPIVTGMPLTAALPEITSTKVPGASTLVLTPACSLATERRVPGQVVAPAVRERDDARPDVLGDLGRHVDACRRRSVTRAERAVADAVSGPRRPGARAACSGPCPSRAR